MQYVLFLVCLTAFVYGLVAFLTRDSEPVPLPRENDEFKQAEEVILEQEKAQEERKLVPPQNDFIPNLAYTITYDVVPAKKKSKPKKFKKSKVAKKSKKPVSKRRKKS